MLPQCDNLLCGFFLEALDLDTEKYHNKALFIGVMDAFDSSGW